MKMLPPISSAKISELFTPSCCPPDPVQCQSSSGTVRATAGARGTFQLKCSHPANRPARKSPCANDVPPPHRNTLSEHAQTQCPYPRHWHMPSPTHSTPHQTASD